MNVRPIIGAADVFSPSPSAARCARWLAVATGAPFELVYVFDRGGLPALPRMEPGIRQELYDAQDERVMARAIERLATLTSAATGIRTSATVLEGLPVPTLRELAAERNAALLVTGTAAREGLRPRAPRKRGRGARRGRAVSGDGRPAGRHGARGRTGARRR